VHPTRVRFHRNDKAEGAAAVSESRGCGAALDEAAECRGEARVKGEAMGTIRVQAQTKPDQSKSSYLLVIEEDFGGQEPWETGPERRPSRATWDALARLKGIKGSLP